jgi:transcriptional/translational regulatory protein YebC/TACO1
VQSLDKTFEVTCDPTKFEQVAAALKEARIPADAAEVTRVSSSKVELGLEDARRVVSLVSALEDHEDVQSVTANYSIPDEMLEAVLAGLQ